MIPLHDAQELVLDSCIPGTPTSVPIDEALGCVVATPVLASDPVPPFVNSSRDGYAFRSVDTIPDHVGASVRLAVIGTIMAGSPLDRPIGPGQAARIMTGAPLPDGADAVCMLEDCSVSDGGTVVVVDHPVAKGEAVRYAGEDVSIGDVLATAGTVLTPAHLGVLANQGRDEVRIHPRPRVGILSTGDELVAGTGPLAPGQIRDANRHALLGLVRREGWTAVDLGIVGDDESALTDALDQAGATCDAIVTSGGVSVGDLDIVKLVLQKRTGGTMQWMQVAIRPAKPFAFGILEASGTPAFGVPGNPVSAMVSFELLVRPGIRRIAGHNGVHRAAISAVADADLNRRPDGKIHFVRSILRVDEAGQWRLQPVAGQDSHQLKAMAEANSLAVLPDGDGVTAGGRVHALPTDTDWSDANGAAGGGRLW
jgi:molybdopterin molybdotransferase